MKVTLIKDWNAYKSGEVVYVSDERGTYLKKIGTAEPDVMTKKTKPEPKKSVKKAVKKTAKSKEE